MTQYCIRAGWEWNITFKKHQTVCRRGQS